MKSLVETGSERVLRRMRDFDVPENQNFIRTVQAARPISDIMYFPIKTQERLFGFWAVSRAGLKSPYYENERIDLCRFLVGFLNDAFDRSLLPPPSSEDTAYLDANGRVLASGARIREAFEEIFGKASPSPGERRGRWRNRDRFQKAFKVYREGPKRVGADRLTLCSDYGDYHFLFCPYSPCHLVEVRPWAPYATIRLLGSPSRCAESSAGRPAEWMELGYLTPRERQIAVGIYRGWSNKEIAYSLKINEGTVKRYTHNIYEKAAVHSRVEFVLRRRVL
jgi:DNA-binding CsgD family transcriptional regulator